MAMMTVVYRTPVDPKEFRKHYFEVHVPLASQLPGLRNYEVSEGSIMTPIRDEDVFFVSTLHFDDMAMIRAAFACPRVCA